MIVTRRNKANPLLGRVRLFGAVGAFFLLLFLSERSFHYFSSLKTDAVVDGQISPMIRKEKLMPLNIDKDALLKVEKERDEWRARALAAEAKKSFKVGSEPDYSSAATYISALKKHMRVGQFSTYEKGQDLWKLWEEQGVHVVPVHYYSPIVSDEDLEQHYVARKGGVFDMMGVDMNDSLQHKILLKMMMAYRDEVVAFPESLPGGIDASTSLTYYYKQGMFNVNDASLYHTIIRHFRPERIIEVGSGSSLKVSMAAASLNDREVATKTDITVVEPFPNQSHNSHLLKAKGINRLITKKIQDVPLDEFSVLKANDILFLDSSHVVGTGSDTVHEFLKILPRLAQGVIIHVHDIFLPNELPSSWVRDEHRGWAEQYLLLAFLMYNSEFEVVASSSYIKYKHSAEIMKTMPERFATGGGSFWFRRVPSAE